jgi:hypothetical protein
MTTSTMSHHAHTAAAIRPRTLAVFGATAASLVVWAVARQFGDLTVHFGSASTIHTVGGWSVAVAATLAGLGAWGLLAVLERSTRSARTAWTSVAVGVLLVSLAGPLGSGVGAATKAGLICVHLAAAGVLIPALAKTTRRR